MTRREFWDRYLRVYDALNTMKDYQDYIREVAHLACRRPGELILDAGSGTGNLSIRMKELGAEVVGLDFSPVALRIHREKDSSARLTQASLESPLPFGDETFDCVVCASVLFSLPMAGVHLALREFRRVLKPEGRLVVTAGRRGISKVRFALDYFLARLQSQSLRAFVREMRFALGPLLRAMYFNLRMRGLRRQDGYRRFSREQLSGEVAGAGFGNIAYGTTYSGLFHIVHATVDGAGEVVMSGGMHLGDGPRRNGRDGRAWATRMQS